MKLSQLAEISGYSVSTIYDYLRSGLLHAPLKEGPTRSVFDQSHLDRLNRIRILKQKKIPLAEIRKMMGSEGNGGDGAGGSAKQQIVEKALELFSKRHYENTKISDITGALNMGSGTFYRYFKSKEELFLECLEQLPEVMVPREAWDEVLAETDILKRLRKRGYAMFNAFPSYTGIIDYAKLSLGSENKNLAKKAAECIQSLVLPLKKDLQQFMQKGSVRKVDVELIAYLLLGINETFFHRMLIDSKYTVDEGFDIIEEFIGYAITSSSINGRPEDLKGIPFQLTDIQGNRILLENVCFDREDRIRGFFLEGELQVAIRDIAEVEFKRKKGCVEAGIVSISGNQIHLGLKPDSVLSGSTDMGEFQIRVKKVVGFTRQ